MTARTWTNSAINNNRNKTEIEIFFAPSDSEVTHKRGILFRSVAAKIPQNHLSSLRPELTWRSREATVENSTDIFYPGEFLSIKVISVQTFTREDMQSRDKNRASSIPRKSFVSQLQPSAFLRHHIRLAL